MHLSPLRRSAATAALTLGMVALGVAPAMAQPSSTTVEGGATPAADAAGWSQLGFADGAAPTVLIATDGDFADALTAGAVQGLLQAPLLLTATEALSPETAAEIQRLGAEEAVIFGGQMAVSDAVEAELEALGLTTERVMGQTRIETAVAAQQRFFPSATGAVLARAFGTETDPTQAFADTIGLGVYSAVTALPVLLTETEQLTGNTRDAITASTIDTVVIAGGEAAVSAATASEVDGLATGGTTEETPDVTVRRVAGNTRFATAVALNADAGYASAADSPRVILVEGQADDAWVGGLPAASQAGNGASIVLANGDFILAPTFDFLFDADVPLICGPGVTQVACDKALDALQGNGEADMPAPGETGGGDEEPAPEPGGNPITDLIDELLPGLIPGS